MAVVLLVHLNRSFDNLILKAFVNCTLYSLITNVKKKKKILRHFTLFIIIDTFPFNEYVRQLPLNSWAEINF